MQTKLRVLAVAGVAALGFASGPAMADSITPDSYSTTIGVGGTATISKTVTVSAGTPTSATADVYFLSDTTGSMSGTISAVQSGFSTIVSSLSGFGNIAFGAGEFKDLGDSLPLNGGSYKIDQAISTNAALTQSAINGWSAFGGGDLPEQALSSLRTASDPSTGWRAGAQKIVVLTGDAPSHDEANPPPAIAGTTTATTAADLSANGVTVLSVDVGNLNGFGQFDGANSIYANGAAGSYSSSLDPTTLVDTILAGIGSVFQNYSTVTLDLSGVPAGLAVNLVPTDYTGAFDRSIDRFFDFDLSFTGIVAGIYDFSINALVDGGIIATETDHIVVTGSAVPEPASMTLLVSGLLGLAWVRRRRSA